MLALSMLLSWRSSSVAPATLVRSAVEASGRAFVFMDPGLSDAERGVLALAERMHEHQQFKKLVQSNPLFEARDEQALADLRDANGRISAIRRAAKDRGWVVPQRSSFTSVVRAVLEGADKGSFGRVSVMYSSIAHAVPHLLVVNSWMLDGKTDDEWGVGWQELDDEVVLEFTLVTLSAYARAVHRQIEAFGWPPSAWERWLGHARAVLRRSLPASH
jgi:hypothetical protein